MNLILYKKSRLDMHFTIVCAMAVAFSKWANEIYLNEYNSANCEGAFAYNKLITSYLKTYKKIISKVMDNKKIWDCFKFAFSLKILYDTDYLEIILKAKHYYM